MIEFYNMLILLLFLIFSNICYPLTRDDLNNHSLIILKNLTFDPLKEIPKDEDFGFGIWRDTSQKGIFIIQFNKTPQKEDKESLKKFGVEIIYYIPNNAYLVNLNPINLEDIKKIKNLRAIFPLPKWAKIDFEILKNEKIDKIEGISVKNKDISSIANYLLKKFNGIEFITKEYHHKKGRFVLKFDRKNLRNILDVISGFQDIISIIPWYEKIPLNDDSIWVGQSYDTTNKRNYNLSATIWNHQITGTNQIIAVCDTGLDSDMCYFRYDSTPQSKTTYQTPIPPSTGTLDMTKKVIAYYLLPNAVAYDTNYYGFHGTHVSGTVLGDNFLNLSTPTYGGHDTGDGMAPNSKLILQDAGNSFGQLVSLVGDLSDIFQQAYNAGARIHNDSWGSPSNTYDSTALDMDEFSYKNEDFLFVVAMGNWGQNPSDGSIGTPATAKNVISVGATTNGSDTSEAKNLMPYSRGPVFDGRLKPDLTAPGQAVNSAYGSLSNEDNNCSTIIKYGTSMATPTVSGLTALARQYFTDGFYPKGVKEPSNSITPSSALLKGIIINGAMPMEGIDLLNSQAISDIPSFDQGWGRINLENVLYFNGDPRILRVFDVRNENGIKTGDFNEYEIYVSSSSEDLKIHLVWTDPESTTIAGANLVNNLDLEVLSPSNILYKGNNFSNGYSIPGGTADNINNVEGVIISNPEVGYWKIKVKGTSVPGIDDEYYSDKQGYALVATYSSCASDLESPQNLIAQDNQTTGIDLEWTAVPWARYYLIYRAKGLNPSTSDFILVGKSNTNFYTDTKVQGGYTYTYKVKASDSCSEGGFSNTSSATYTGNCTLFPYFEGLKSAENNLNTPICDIKLLWNYGYSNCPLGPAIKYNIYRSTDPYFIPSPQNLIYTTYQNFFLDYDVLPFTTYYYIVRAEDSTNSNSGPHNGNEEKNNVLLKATPWKEGFQEGLWKDDGGDTNAKLFLEGEWKVTNQQNHTTGGNFSYHNSKDLYNYKSNQCISIKTPPIYLQANQNPVLSYWVNYNIEYQFDGVVVEISNDGGQNWTPITPNEGYPSTLSQTGNPPSNACGFPSTQGAFTGPNGNNSLTGWIKYTHNLSSYSGQTILLRWRFSSDGGAEFEGFYLDDIEITSSSINLSCSESDALPIPDGSNGTNPLTVFKLNLEGSLIQIDFDETCSPYRVNILYGTFNNLSDYNLSGAVCNISNPYIWQINDENIWFLLVTDNGFGKESLWGSSSFGERNGTNPSNYCGNTTKELTGTCP